jgi:NACalpha-BTF3-like transcription factor
MRIITNDKFISRRGRIGQFVSWGGLAVLFAGMIISFQARPESPSYALYITISFICLAVGFVSANIGGYFLRRWGRRPRPDELVARALKGLDDRFAFVAWTLPVGMVLIGPRGIFVFVTRDQSGPIYADGERWRQPFKISRLITAFGQEGLGNPALEAIDEAEKLRNYLASHLPDLDINEIPITPVVVFLHPRAELHLNNPTVAVVPVKTLKEFVRSPGTGSPMKTPDRQAIFEFLGIPAKKSKAEKEREEAATG